ncbi:MAG: 4Fe-4S dicluster domain-containing protein [Acidobacteriota bacterium]
MRPFKDHAVPSPSDSAAADRARDSVSDEFPAQGAQPPDGVSRRTMLRLMGASFALAGLASCRRPVETIVPYVDAPEDLLPGIPKLYATTMPFGTSAYGLLVESHEGRPVKVEGNALHPASRGAASAWMQAAILDLYDPDRSRRILRRSDAGRREATWDEFQGFWKRLPQAAEGSDGAGMALVTGGYASPTMARLVGEFRRRYPRASLVIHEPLGDENILEGLRRATRRSLRPVHHLDRARTILSLDADFLMTESESLSSARGFAATRPPRGVPDGMSRLYVVESTLTVTGVAADHRLAVPSGRIPGFIAALAVELMRRGLDLGMPPDKSRPPGWDPWTNRLGVIATDLLSSGNQALVMAGRAQPTAVHVLAAVINQALGAVGNTVTWHEAQDMGWGKASDLADLVSRIRGGSVSTLVMLGTNPAYTAPADLDFAGAIARVPHTIHLGTHVDETARLSAWHIPESHFLESWADARCADGSPSIAQPLILPLFGGRSRPEVLDFLTTGKSRNSFSLVSRTWLDGVLGGTDFERRWNRVVHDGVQPDSALPEVSAQTDENAASEAFAAAAAAEPARGESLEIVFRPSCAVFDGRFANNGWLQELPDPVTKITWDNAAIVSPATARRLGVSSGDVVRLTGRAGQVDAPVWVLAGQADGSVALSLGYGRKHAGRVGDGVGANAYLLRRSAAPYIDDGLTIERTGRSHRLAHTQGHWTMEGRRLVREAPRTAYLANPAAALGEGSEPEPEPVPLWKQRDYSTGVQWGMVIDLNACIGCNACITACQSENNIPIVGREQVLNGREMHWLRVDRYQTGRDEEPASVFQPVPCMHCENAPCEEVCPVGATMHNKEGINAQVYNRCIGTRYCSNNCPYKVRRFNFLNYTRELPELVSMAMNPDVTVRSRGVMEKCTYCIQRINEGERQAKRDDRPLKDGDVRTACQQTCPADAIVFGNINDPGSRVTRFKGEDRNYVLLESLGNRPRTSYLAKIRNPHPAWRAG